MHADHHLGVIRLLELRKQLLSDDRKPLLLMSPKKHTESWLYFYDKTYDQIRNDTTVIDNYLLVRPFNGIYFGAHLNRAFSSQRYRESNQFIWEQLGIKSLQTCLVDHVKNSFGISITVPTSNHTDKPQDFKLTYSGDTKPCNRLVALGKESTLLIHEATFGDELSEQAGKRGHCTVSQAIEQAQKMNAKHTILTHFSARYTFPVIDFSKTATNISVACDNMVVTANDLDSLNEISSKAKQIFEGIK